jgi:hypothetical protein
MGYRIPLLPVDRTEDFNSLVGRSSEEQRQDAAKIGESKAEYMRQRGGLGGDILNKGMQGFSWGAGMRQGIERDRRAEEQHRQQQTLGDQAQQQNKLALAEESARQQYMNAPATIDTQGPTRQQVSWQNQVDQPQWQHQAQLQQMDIANKQVAMQGASNSIQNKMLAFNMDQAKIQNAASMYQKANTAAMQTGQPADYTQIDAQLSQAGYKPSEIAMAHFMGNGADPMTQLMMGQVADQQTGGLVSEFATKAKTYQTAIDGLMRDYQIYKDNEGNVAEGSPAAGALERISNTLRDPQIGMNKEADTINSNFFSRLASYSVTGEKNIQRSALLDQAVTNLKAKAERELVQMHEKLPPQYQRLPQVMQGFKSLQQLQTATPGKNDAAFLPPPSNTSVQKVRGGGRTSAFRPGLNQ